MPAPFEWTMARRSLDGLRERLGDISRAVRGHLRKQNWEKLSRNPLVAVALGFLLAGVLGTWLISYSEPGEAQRRAARARLQYEASLKAVQDFTRAAYERREWSALLSSSLRRGADLEELRTRRAKYDEAYIRWGGDLQSYLFLMRLARNRINYADLEDRVERHLASTFRKIDDCLTSAYDTEIKSMTSMQTTPQPAPQTLKIMNECRLSKQLEFALDCISAVTDAFFIRVAEPQGSEASRQSEYKTALGSIEQRCKSQL